MLKVYGVANSESRTPTTRSRSKWHPKLDRVAVIAAILSLSLGGCGEQSTESAVVENDPQPPKATLSFVGFKPGVFPVLAKGESALLGSRRGGKETPVRFLVNNPTNSTLTLSCGDSDVPEFDLRVWDGLQYTDSGNLMGCGLRVMNEVIVAPGTQYFFDVPLLRTDFISQIGLFFYLENQGEIESYLAWSDKFSWPPEVDPPGVIFEYLGPAARVHRELDGGKMLSTRRFLGSSKSTVFRLANPTKQDLLFECRGPDRRPSLAFRSWQGDELTEHRWDFSSGHALEHCTLPPGGELVFSVELSLNPSFHQIGVHFQLAGDTQSYWLWTEKFQLPAE
jgi:hypothetical protein